MKVNELEVTNPLIPKDWAYMDKLDWFINWSKILKNYRDFYNDLPEDFVHDVVEQKIEGWLAYMKNDEERLKLFYSHDIEKLNKSLYNFIDPFIRRDLNDARKNKINELEVSRPLSLIKGNWYIISNGSLEDEPKHKATFQEKSKDYLSNSAIFFINDDPGLTYYIFEKNLNSDHIKPIPKPINEFQNKQIVGTGVEHDIYPDNKNKDRIFKVPKDAVAKDEMYKWIKTFSKYPRIFAKIYRAKDNSYVSLEKLDTSRVQQEYRRLYDYFTTKHPLIDQETSSISSDPLIEMFLIMSLLDSTENKGKIRDIQKRMRQDDPSLLPIFNNWLKLTLIMRDVAERENLAIDFHIDNFGYDKEGNLKMLDI